MAGFNPATTIVSMSAKPSFLANDPPTIPNTDVPNPEATASADCLALKRSSSVAFLICSAVCPADIAPSPTDPAAIADPVLPNAVTAFGNNLLLIARAPRPNTPPAATDGKVSTIP